MEQDPRQAAIQALMKFLQESEAKAAMPEAPPEAPPAEGAPPAPKEGGGEAEMTPEMLQALQSLMG